MTLPGDAAEAARASTWTPSGVDAPSTPPIDAAAAPPVGDVGLPDDDRGGLDAAFDDVTGGSACLPSVAGCDPVHNTGCDPLEQCDVSSLATGTLTGQCVFGGGAVGDACTASIVSESCAPQSTCVAGECRQLCFCDADCPKQQCCSDSSGPGGFNLCRACP